MDINNKDTAVVITDPQNDFLSEKGVTWELVGDSVKENKTVENIERIVKAAKINGFEVFISPLFLPMGVSLFKIHSLQACILIEADLRQSCHFVKTPIAW